MKTNFFLFALVVLACCQLSLSQRSTKKPTTKKPSKTAKPGKSTERPGPSKLSCDQSTPLKFSSLGTDKDLLANPERGYYHHHEIKLSKYSKLSDEEMKKWAKEGVTLALMIFNIEPFVKKPLSDDTLKNIAADFGALRKGGMKGIVRFSYNQTDIKGDPDKYNFPKTTDAEKSQLLSHIKQLATIFKDNVDVINVVQIGFIGHWGEWYYSRNYATEKKGEGWKPDKKQQADRDEIVKALMQAVPKSRMLQIRYPSAKMRLYGNENLKPGGDRTSERARLGIHSDCFLAKGGDEGTFETENNKEAAQRKWLEQEGLSVMVGGESCQKNDKTGCTEAKKQIEKQRFTYLNTDFKETVIKEWRNDKCYNYIGNKIGYRFELVKGSLQLTVKKGASFCLSLDIKNSGVAPLYNERPLEIILRDQKTKQSKSVKPIPYQPKVDPRSFLPGKTTSIQVTVQVPSELSPSQYDVILNLPDGSPSLKDEPKYRILFANGGKVHDKVNRFNIIGQITVQ